MGRIEKTVYKLTLYRYSDGKSFYLLLSQRH